MEVEEVLWTVFRPPDLPGARLSALGRQEGPSDEVVGEVNELLASARDLEAFLELVPTPTWLQKLNQGARPLDPLGQSGVPWIARRAVVRLSKDHREETVEWVMEIFGRNKGDSKICVSLASTLLDMGPPAIADALKIAERHPDEGMLVLRVVDALRDCTDLTSIVVKDAADLFLNNLVQNREDSNPTLHGGLGENYYLALLGMLFEGATHDNAASRLGILAQKLEIAHRHWSPPTWYRGMAEMLGGAPEEMSSELWMFPLGYAPEAPISRLGERDLEDFGVKAVHAISACLVRIFQSAMRWLPASILLDVAAEVPEPLGYRLRLWALSEADDAAPEDMVQAIESALASRLPNCDDVAVIDRVMSLNMNMDEDIIDSVSRWRTALGEPPTRSEAEQAVNSGSTWKGYGWLYPYLWVPLLPDAATSIWTGSEGFQLLARELHPRGRAHFDEIANRPFKPEIPVRSGPLESPLAVDDLGCMAPADAAKEIASCPVAQDDWTRESLIRGNVLQRLVKANPSGWGEDPNRIAELLRYHTYISHYLTAFSTFDSEQLGSADIDGLVDMIIGVLGEPRPVKGLGSEDVHAEESARDREEVRRAAIWLVRQLLVTEVGLAGRNQEVWELLELEAKTIPHNRVPTGSEEISPLALRQRSDGQYIPEQDPHDLATNQQNTQALDTALLLAVHEHNVDAEVRPQVPDLIEWCLGVAGEEGAKYRVIIAARVGFLLHALPDWLEENKGRLFGNDILGQIALDQVLRTAWPYEWICTNFHSEMYDAAHRGVERALDWILIAMLNGTEGYDPESVIEQLDARVPEVCRVLARLLDYPSSGEDTSEDKADRLFELLLGKKQRARSLGWLARTDTMPHDKWAALTFRTVEATGGEIDMSQLVIRRVFNNEPTEDSIHILKRLIEVQCNPAHALTSSDHEGSECLDRAIWDRMTIAEEAPKWLKQDQGTNGSSDAHQQLRETLRRHGLLKDPTSGQLNQASVQDLTLSDQTGAMQ